ncbi:MAG: glycosyltransferase, partial [Bacteriovorax sp.]
KEVVDEDCGYVSKDNTPESYFKILKHLYEGAPDLPKKIERASIKVESLFSKSSMLKKIAEIYSL